MKVLVTGGAGYIGSVVSSELVAAGHLVTVLDDLSTGRADAVPPQARLVVGDLTASHSMMATTEFDAVMHFAAKSLVGESMRNPSLYWRNNLCGTRTLLDAMDAAGVSRLVFSSTAATYGTPDRTPIEETAPGRPTNPYGSSKLAVDQMLTDQANTRGMNAISLRYFNVAGASGRYGELHAEETHLIPLALRTAQGVEPALPVFGNDYPTPDGTCIRDFIHVSDLARAHLLALDATTRPGHHIYNLGSGAGYSVRDVLDAIKEVTGSVVPTRAEPRRPGDPPILVASYAKIRGELGWSPEMTLARMIEDAWVFQRSQLPTGLVANAERDARKADLDERS